MTYTDCGKKVSRDWMPLAMANGITGFAVACIGAGD